MTQKSKSVLADAMSETQLEMGCMKLFKLLKYIAYHTVNSRGSRKGFPDWVVIGSMGKNVILRLLFIELKTETYFCTPQQIVWLSAVNKLANLIFKLTGHRYLYACVFRPSDYISGKIEDTLKGVYDKDPNVVFFDEKKEVARAKKSKQAASSRKQGRRTNPRERKA